MKSSTSTLRNLMTMRRNWVEPRVTQTRNMVCSSSSIMEHYRSTPKETVGCVVIGAGAVGIAVAKELSTKKGREVLVIESAPSFGTGTNSRNSEVVHVCIYYPHNSRKVGELKLFNQYNHSRY